MVLAHSARNVTIRSITRVLVVPFIHCFKHRVLLMVNVVASVNNDFVKLIDVHDISMTSDVRVHFSLFIYLVYLLSELDKILLCGKALSLGHFSKRASEVFEEHTASLDNLFCLTFTIRFDRDLLNLVNLNEVN